VRFQSVYELGAAFFFSFLLMDFFDVTDDSNREICSLKILTTNASLSQRLLPDFNRKDKKNTHNRGGLERTLARVQREIGTKSSKRGDKKGICGKYKETKIGLLRLSAVCV
jgi:hypothetical protein